MEREQQEGSRWAMAQDEAELAVKWGAALWGVLIYSSVLAGAIGETPAWFGWLGLSALTYLGALWSSWRRLGRSMPR